jgi:hypothetical protein
MSTEKFLTGLKSGVWLLYDINPILFEQMLLYGRFWTINPLLKA